MSWIALALAASSLLGLALVLRLATLNRRQTIYRVFCLYLVFDLFQTVLTFTERYTSFIRLDYRITWIGMRGISWALSLWMVYALIDAVMARFPGVLRFSRKLLNAVLIIAVILAILTGRLEYLSFGPLPLKGPLDQAVFIALVLERVISTVAILALGSILAFTLWFPVRMPKNLAVFSIGFIVYFGTELSLLLVQSFWLHQPSKTMNIILISLSSACYAYWLLFLDAKGEIAPVTLGHSWSKPEQQRLVGQLEAMNAALLRAARR